MLRYNYCGVFAEIIAANVTNDFPGREFRHAQYVQGSNRNILIKVVVLAVSSAPSLALVRRKAVTPRSIELLHQCHRLVVNCL